MTTGQAEFLSQAVGEKHLGCIDVFPLVDICPA